MARLAGIEPTTPWFVAKYSIQLSYSREEKDYSRVLSIWGSVISIAMLIPEILLWLTLGPMVNIMSGFVDLLAQFSSLFRRQSRRRAIALLFPTCFIAAAVITPLALCHVLARLALAPPLRRFGLRRSQCKEQRDKAQPGGQALHC